ncbi:MAG: hypothetical protein AAF666_16140 [Pseudomonadota bacterium]
MPDDLNFRGHQSAHQTASHSLPGLEMLADGRVHEATGPGRMTFALALAGQLAGAVLWLQDRRQGQTLYPNGIAEYFDPARLIYVRPTGQLEMLQLTEEALRSGAAPLVVVDLQEAPDLTESRRLQLAAGTGGGRGLCLIPEGRLKTNAAETRWSCMPMPGGCARQHWEIVKNKRGRLGKWQAAWDGTAFRAVEEAPEPA